MSIPFRRRAHLAVIAAAIVAGAALLPVQIGCSSNPSSYDHPNPSISAFTPGTYNPVTRVFTPNPALTVAQGGSAWLRANFAVNNGTAIVTPGNIPVQSNVPFQVTNLTATTTYTLKVTSEDGKTATATATVTVITAPSNLTYADEDATYYQGVQITANTPTVSGTNPITYSIDPALPTGLTLNANTGVISGTPQVTSPRTAYTVTATNSAGSTTRTIHLTVAATPLTFSVAPDQITLGNSAILSWDANVVPGVFSSVSITANPADASLSGPFGLSGTKNVSPAVSTAYTLSATPANGGSAVTRTVNVTVGTAPVHFTSFSAVPNPPLYGGSTTLSWTYTGIADTLTLNGDNVLGLSSVTVSPIRRQAYTLHGSNAMGGDTLFYKIAAKGLHHLAGSISSGRGNVDGGVDVATGASNARFYRPNAIVWDEKANDGTMIVADFSNHLIRRITPDRTVTTIAGTPGVAGAAANNADTSTLLSPRNTAVDPVTGDIYVGGENYTAKRLLKLTPNGDGTYTPSVVPNFATNTNAMIIDENRILHFIEYSGTAGNYYTMDLKAATPLPILVGNLASAGVTGAVAIAKDFNGGRRLLYVVCSNKIMKINIAGSTPVVSLFAGTGTSGFKDDLVATNGQLANPQGVAVDTAGNVYIADRDNYAVRMVPASGPLAGALITIAGKTGTKAEGYASSSITLDGTATLPTSDTACLSSVYYVLAQGDGGAGSKIYVADAAGTTFDNQSIRTITVTSPGPGQLTYTLDDPTKPGVAYAGSPRLTGNADGTGAAARFSFGTSCGANLTNSGSGNFTFVADTNNNLVRAIYENGQVQTLRDNSATDLAFDQPRGIAAQRDSNGNMIALFVSDTGTTTKKLRKFTPNLNGTFTEVTSFNVSGGSYPASPNLRGLAVDHAAGYLYATDYTANKVFKINTETGACTDFVADTGAGPIGVAVDASKGELWVAVSGGKQVKKYSLTDGILQLTVGTGLAGWVDGPSGIAAFGAPTGIAVGRYGAIFVTDFNSSQTAPNNGIRVIDPTTYAVSTLLGSPTSTTSATYTGLRPGYFVPDNASGSLQDKRRNGAVLYAPQGLTLNMDGDLVVSTPNAVYLVAAPEGH